MEILGIKEKYFIGIEDEEKINLGKKSMNKKRKVWNFFLSSVLPDSKKNYYENVAKASTTKADTLPTSYLSTSYECKKTSTVSGTAFSLHKAASATRCSAK